MDIKNKSYIYILLHVLLMLYSMCGIFSKLAANAPFFSVDFFLYYSLIIILLAIYAIGWQQVIKHIPLTTAFANKAITIIWGMVWGSIIFDEVISLAKIIGSMLVISGVILFAVSED